MADQKVSQTPALYMQETTDIVQKQIQDLQDKGEINFPKNYSPSNALRSAALMLQETEDKDGKLALAVCTPQSIKNALFNMVLLALSPAKKQVYPIVRGTKLCMDTSYFGVIAATKRLPSVVDIFAQVIYKDDRFGYDIRQSRKIIRIHEQELENIDVENIIGAYCTILYKDSDGTEKEYTEVMSMNQIKKSWSKTKMKNNTVQQEFAEEMAKRTVIKRTCKLFVNTSDDSDLIIEAYNETTGMDPVDKEIEVAEEIKTNANKETINVNYKVEDSDPDPAEAANTQADTSAEEKKDDTADTAPRKPGF